MGDRAKSFLRVSRTMTTGMEVQRCLMDSCVSEPQSTDSAITMLQLLANGKEHQDKQLCFSCNEQLVPTSNIVEHQSVFREGRGGSILHLKCQPCNKTVCVYVCGQWWSLREILHSNRMDRNGFQQVQTFTERVILHTLNRIVFREQEQDEDTVAVFLPTPAEEFAKLMWDEGEAVGFYTVKTKGKVYESSFHERYTMPVVDIIFVRKKGRGLGFGENLLKDMVSMFPVENFGFSHPVSPAMYQVLLRYLHSRPHMRDRIWVTTYTGDEGYRRNVWLLVRHLATNVDSTD
ncbi:PREDICTED: protein FAM169B-like isoform X2 [Priapulus caudatus]|uniref:Protein FAM169B-like isoform X2 n=1 Tax=Priapulus caudatus TaxID=37621 RepID=A0ABM1EQR5_PRICU|nr:PREDICTED: protein FAM169B-like isoform X2 [Priapulus caudatus]